MERTQTMSFSKKELIKILAKDPIIKIAEDIQNVNIRFKKVLNLYLFH